MGNLVTAVKPCAYIEKKNTQVFDYSEKTEQIRQKSINI